MLNLKNKILLIILLILSSLLFTQLGTFDEQMPKKSEAKAQLPEVAAKQFDPRVQILADYFGKYNSPLKPHAQDFIDAADTYGVDWKLVPSIAGVESTFGKHSYGYNAWGWGIYGDQALGFSSWRHGIFTVTEGLKKNYINRGLTNPFTMNRVYAASPTWGWRVNFFINDLEGFAKKYPVQVPLDGTNQTAAASAEIAYK